MPSVASNAFILPFCLALITLGCSHLPEANPDATAIAEGSAAVEQPKLDDIPLATENTDTVAPVAALDMQSQELERTDIKSPEIDLWQRLRDGFALTPESMPASVTKQRDWYLRNPSYLKTVFERAEPFIYYVTEQLSEAGLPLELALLPIVESTYDPLAYSHSHAVGLWQFIPSTGASLGLRRDRWYDGRRDVVASTDAAITYLTRLHRRFDSDWLLALAAYNSGQGYVSKSIRRNRKAQKGTDFWSISLPRETRNYVPQLLALATLIRAPQKYDLELPAIANQPYFEIVEISSQIDLGKVIQLSDIEVAEFTRLNPAYRRALTPPESTHSLLLPLGQAQPLRDLLATTDPKTWVPHTEYSVVSGDTLSEIALRFDIPTSWLRERNKLKSDRLRIRQVLLIPHAGENGSYLTKVATDGTQEPLYYNVSSGDSLWSIAKQFNTSIKRLRETNKLSSNTLQVNDRLVVGSQNATVESEHLRKLSYRVRRGDSLSLIASRFDVAISDITGWNKIRRSALLQPGQRLTLFINALKI
ncbi:MAG: LysM peptidoglycan-binding domain-containing protein [Porticoccaceae bacterium]|nr:LysM peptidoglycan-binding domain-containing protein [Porticoccaceae bacterium]